MPTTTRVFSVQSVQLALTKNEPPDLLIAAFGMVTSIGWNDIALVPLEKEPSADGILDLAFVGTPPPEVFIPFPNPVVAHYVWKNAAKAVGVKVSARSNEVTQLLFHQGGGGWPPPITQIAGEGHGVPQGPAAHADFAGPKTLAIGEEHLTSLWVGEEHGPITTLVFGEEGPTHLYGEGPTTEIGGEEGPTHLLGETPTFFEGEHGPTIPIAEHPSIPVAEHPSIPIAEHPSNPIAEHPSIPIAEHPSNVVAEQPSSAGAEQIGPQPDPWNQAGFGVNAFGRR